MSIYFKNLKIFIKDFELINDDNNLLKKVEKFEENIKNVVETSSKLTTEKVGLLQVNTQLKTELKSTKDSLERVKYELKETKLKLPKKRNFLQKVLGVAKDSIEVIKTDTIQN